LDDNSWSIVQADYDVFGRKIATSMPEKLTGPESSFSPANKTSFTLDVFDRPLTIQAPDSRVTNIAYAGVRRVDRTLDIATGSITCSSANRTTTEIHDALGRLVQVTEPSGGTTSVSNPCGSNTTTSYEYDAADHLNVAATLTQTRRFTYDGRGLLISEQHP